MKVDCRTCEHWYDHSAGEAAGQPAGERRFYGCLLHGVIEEYREMQNCPDFQLSPEPFILCVGCRVLVPKTCLLLGECANCTDTDLFCLDRCTGGSWRKYCTHWLRLQTDGKPIVVDDHIDEVRPREAPRKPAGRRRTLREIFARSLARRRMPLKGPRSRR